MRGGSRLRMFALLKQVTLRLKILLPPSDNEIVKARVLKSELRRRQEGFTLPELMVVILVMGIIAAITIPTWRNVTESQALTASTNQVVADLRKAHSAATNRLTDQVVEFTAGQKKYRMGPSGNLKDRPLPSEGAHTRSANSVTVTFKPDGTATIIGTAPVQISLDKISPKSSEIQNIGVNAATSRVRLD